MKKEIIEEIIDLIQEYITEEECLHAQNNEMYCCLCCDNFENCCMETKIRYNDDFNNVFAQSIDYGGYDNEDEFWEQLLD